MPFPHVNQSDVLVSSSDALVNKVQNVIVLIRSQNQCMSLDGYVRTSHFSLLTSSFVPFGLPGHVSVTNAGKSVICSFPKIQSKSVYIGTSLYVMVQHAMTPLY